MPRRPVFTDVMSVVERRIAEGDYMLKDLPGERRLAEEVGVSYMTARKAVHKLIEKRILSRKPNGALAVHPGVHSGPVTCRVALLTPAYPSSHLIRCRLAISQAAEKMNVQFRPVEYMHWYDPIVTEALEGSDGLFVIPSTEPIPQPVLKKFSSGDHRVVFFDDDMTRHGIPSIRLFGSSHIAMLFEHLWALGHRRIDCLNAQGRNGEIDRRIGEWRSWLDARGGEGTLWDKPAVPYGDPHERGHEGLREILRSEQRPTAIVCTTQPAALGAIRACRDAGLSVGEEIAICTVNNEPTGRYFCPSLTGLEMPSIEPLMPRCFAWFRSARGSWEGSLCITPRRPTLFVGESTAGCRPAKKPSRARRVKRTTAG